jgi:2'-5' RNA ligase
MRLFTALWPPPEAVEALTAASAGEPTDGWRRTDPSTWHITLAFHGEAQLEPSVQRLDAAVAGARAPRLRLHGAGRFDGVRWAGVQSAPAGALAALAHLAGARPGEFVAHVTLLRRRGRPDPHVDGPEPPTPWAEHTGPWWRPHEVLLVASEPGGKGVHYRPVHRVPLTASNDGADGGDQAV